MFICLLIWLAGQVGILRRFDNTEDKVCGSLLWASGSALITAAFVL